MFPGRVVLGLAGLIVAASAALGAEIPTAVDQIPQKRPSGVAASTPLQVSPAPSDRTSVGQLPPGATERDGASRVGQGLYGRAERAPNGVAPEPDRPDGALLPHARSQGSVSADEIARLLDRGEAASIDAAAAIAAGVAEPAQQVPSLEDVEDAIAERMTPGGANPLTQR